MKYFVSLMSPVTQRHGVPHAPRPGELPNCQVLQSYPGPEGKKQYNDITMSPLSPPEGTQKRVVEVIRDITRRKHLEEALQESQEETRLC